MRSLAPLLLALASASATLAQPALPRQSPEFVVKFPNGQEILLSSYRGKVVVVEGLLTTCPHCQATSQMLERLYKELRPQGLQVIGIGFNQFADKLVDAFVRQFGISFPVGYSDEDHIKGFIGAPSDARLMAPQMVIIDRKRVIRAQSGPQGAPELQDEQKLRKILEPLLKEGSTTSKGKSTAPTKSGG